MRIKFVDSEGNPVKVSEDFENQVEYALKNIHRTRKRYKVNARKLVLSVVCAILFITTGIIVYAMSNKPQEPEVTQTILSDISYPIIEVTPLPTTTPSPTTTPTSEPEPEYFKPEKLDTYLFDIVVEECETLNIPVNFVLAVMKTETQDFNASATNHNTNGTYDSGIMQINSSNIQHFSERYDLPEFAENPHDPENNIRVGIRYLAENYHVYYEYYDGDEIKTLLATAGSYNRGVSNQNKYKNVYDYNARVYAHYQNLEAGIDENINYQTDIPPIKEWLRNNISLA